MSNPEKSGNPRASSRRVRNALQGAAIAALLAVVLHLPAVERAERSLRRAVLTAWPPETDATTPGGVQVVDLGSQWSQPGPKGAALCRTLAETIRASLQAGARVVGIDVVTEAGVNEVTGCAGDPEVRAAASSERVVLATLPPPDAPPKDARIPLAHHGSAALRFYPEEGESVGLVPPHGQPSSLAIELARVALDVAGNGVDATGSSLRIGPRIERPLRTEDDTQVIPIRWRSSIRAARPAEVIRSDPALASSWLRDRIVLIGAVSTPQPLDVLPSPFGRETPGAIVQAEVVATLLLGGAARPVPFAVSLLLTVFVAAALAAWSSGRRHGLLLAGAGLLAVAALVPMLWIATCLELPLFSLLGAVIAGSVAPALPGSRRRAGIELPAIQGADARAALMRDRYPRPLAQLYFAAAARTGGGIESAYAWCDLIEACTWYVVALTLAELSSGDGHPGAAAKLSASHKIDPPSFGTFRALWRDGGRLIGNPRIAELVPSGKNERKLGKDFDAILSWRNENRGHTLVASLTTQDIADKISEARGLAEALLFEWLAFLGRYPFFIVRRCTPADGDAFAIAAEPLGGIVPSPAVQLRSSTPLREGHLYVLTHEWNATAPVSSDALPLSPYVLLRRCRRHQQDEFFFHAGGLRSGRPAYQGLGPDCETEPFTPGDGLQETWERAVAWWKG